MPFQSATVTKSVAIGGPGSREARIIVSIADTTTPAGQEVVIIEAGQRDASDPFPNTYGLLSLTKAQFDALVALVAAVVADARQGATPG
jgi:hypothetical protein